METQDFTKAKIGQKIWYYLDNVEATIVNTNSDMKGYSGESLPIKIEYYSCLLEAPPYYAYLTADGKLNPKGGQVIFWSKPDIAPPPPPKIKVKKVINAFFDLEESHGSGVILVFKIKDEQYTTPVTLTFEVDE